MANRFANWEELERNADGRVDCESDVMFDPGFYAGDRIGVPFRTASHTRKLISLVICAGGGWGLLHTYDAWLPWWSAVENGFVAAFAERKGPEVPPGASGSNAVPQASGLPPLEAHSDIAEVPGTEPLPSSEATLPASQLPQAAASSPPAEEKLSSPAAVPLAEPQADPADPYQKRALAIGLHPGISNVLLSSMSDADYRSAEIAIRTALAEAADTDKFIWPRKQKAKQAVFQIHFVTGDGQDCRRYIVTVVKNGWTTTAPPMVKCGTVRRHAVPKPQPDT